MLKAGMLKAVPPATAASAGDMPPRRILSPMLLPPLSHRIWVPPDLASGFSRVAIPSCFALSGAGSRWRDDGWDFVT